jgi:thiol-disulfide isomerase/thioredoxin
MMNWSIETLDGSSAPAMSDFLGHPLLILFFSVRCPGCKSRALPFSKEMARVFPDLKVVGIHTKIDKADISKEQIEGIRQLFKIPYPIYKDQEKASSKLLEAEGTPHWILIDREGKVDRSIFGSMPNSLQRLDYSITELFQRDNSLSS